MVAARRCARQRRLRRSGKDDRVSEDEADRLASGDPRLSIEERYPSFSVYAVKVEKAVEDLVAKRLMLREDAQPAIDRLLRAGQATVAIRIDAISK